MPQVTVGDYEFTYSPNEKGDKWFYHPNGTALIGNSYDSDDYYAEGYFDSPDDFPGDGITEVTEEEPQKIDIDSWAKEKLLDYAVTVFGEKIDKRLSKAKVLARVKELENGDV